MGSVEADDERQIAVADDCWQISHLQQQAVASQLILRRIVKVVATKCQILRLKCTKIDFGASAPDPLGELTALSQPP